MYRCLARSTSYCALRGLESTYVQVECHQQKDLAERVQDLPDLRHVGWIQHVRDTPQANLPDLFRDCVDAGLRDADGLPWGMATDPRNEALAGLLGQEVFR